MTPLTTSTALAAQEAGEHQLVDVLGQRRARGVRGDRVEPERDRDLDAGRRSRRGSRRGRPCGAASASKVDARSSFCIRYMPTLRLPLRGSRVITAGSVMNGAASPGQQVWTGSRSRSTSSPGQDDLLAGARADGARPRVGDRLQLLQPARASRAGPAAAASRARRRASRRASSSDSTPKREAHAPLGAELVDQQRQLAALRVLEEERRPAGLDVRSTISVTSRCGSTSAATRTSSPSRSSSAIQSRRSPERHRVGADGRGGARRACPATGASARRARSPPRKISPTISIPRMTCLPSSVAASASSDRPAPARALTARRAARSASGAVAVGRRASRAERARAPRRPTPRRRPPRRRRAAARAERDQLGEIARPPRPPALGDPDEPVRVEVVAEQQRRVAVGAARTGAAGRSGRGSPRRSSRARARSARRRAARRPRSRSGLGPQRLAPRAGSRPRLVGDRRPEHVRREARQRPRPSGRSRSSPWASETNIASNCDGAT